MFSIRHFVTSQNGAVAVEYALLASFVGLGIVAALISTKTSLNGRINTISAKVGNVVSDAYYVGLDGVAMVKSSVVNLTDRPRFFADESPTDSRCLPKIMTSSAMPGY